MLPIRIELIEVRLAQAVLAAAVAFAGVEGLPLGVEDCLGAIGADEE